MGGTGSPASLQETQNSGPTQACDCLLYTSDAADETSTV